MAGRVHDCGARLLRVLGVLTVVAGVFAMHGLTAHHDAAMAAPHAPMAAPMAAPMVREHVEPVELHVVPADEMHGMGGVCLAVLTGLVLVLALLLGLRSLLAWRVVSLPAAGARVVLGERAPPWMAPSLSSLGLLRI